MKITHHMDETLLTLAETLARVALQEDLGTGDITGNALLDDTVSSARVLVKQDGVICGLQWLEVVFGQLDAGSKVVLHCLDGERVKSATVVAEVEGPLRTLVAGERVALNLIQRLSGIATLTARMADAIEGTRAMVFDTRKTTPGLRAFEKYAVVCGGGGNHRMGLYDEAMIKENHLRLGGWTLAEAIERIRNQNPDITIHAEAETVDEAIAALSTAPNVLLLDEFSHDDIRSVLAERGNDDANVERTQIEVSGGITLETIREFAETGIERISVGALTHSAPALDVSFDVAKPQNH